MKNGVNKLALALTEQRASIHTDERFLSSLLATSTASHYQKILPEDSGVRSSHHPGLPKAFAVYGQVYRRFRHRIVMLNRFLSSYCTSSVSSDNPLRSCHITSAQSLDPSTRSGVNYTSFGQFSYFQLNHRKKER